MSKKTIFLNFDCDDINPYNEMGWKNIVKLKEEFPEMFVTLYAPIAWHGHRYEQTDLLKYKIDDKVEIGLHGLLHISPCNEYGETEFLCSDQYLKSVLRLADERVFTKLVRPPGWHIRSPEIVEESGLILAGHPDDYSNLTFLEIHKDYDLNNINEYVIIHSHISAYLLTMNSISDDKNYENTRKIIKKLYELYDIKWVSQTEIYTKVIKK